MTESENFSSEEINQNQLLDLLEELQTENERYQTQIQQLSSEKQELTSVIAELRNRVAQQQEQIEKLNGSDLVLKENEKLKKLNSELQKSEKRTKQEAMTEVSDVKREYAEKEKRLAETQAEADRLKAEAEATRKRQNEFIRQKAMELYHEKEKSLKSAYKSKELLLDGKFLGVLLYGILCTVFTAVRSERFASDFKAFFSAIWTILLTVGEKLLELAIWASQLGNMIPQPIVAVIIHWIILLAVIILVGGGAGYFLFFGVSKAYAFYKENYADTTSLAVALVSLAVAVFFAEPIRTVVPINLLLLLILIHAVYVGVRWYVKGWRESRGYY